MLHQAKDTAVAPIALITLAREQPAVASCLQNGQLKAKVNGANVPLLASSIYELTPANAEIDELEVRAACKHMQRTGCSYVHAAHIQAAVNASTCAANLMQRRAALPQLATKAVVAAGILAAYHGRSDVPLVIRHDASLWLCHDMPVCHACLQENPFYLSKNASKDGSKGPDKHKSAKKK